MKYFLLIVFLSFSVAQSEAATLLPQELIPPPPNGVLICEFTQTKYLKDIPRPLTTKGKLIFWRDHGLIWQTLAPFPSILVLTPEGVQGLENGQTVKNQFPHQEKLFLVMSHLMSGEIFHLEGFKIRSDSNKKGQWVRILTPTNPGIQQVFKSIILSGGAHVEHITIERPTGDLDEIDFFHYKLGSRDLLNSAERTWLGDA